MSSTLGFLIVKLSCVMETHPDIHCPEPDIHSVSSDHITAPVKSLSSLFWTHCQNQEAFDFRKNRHKLRLTSTIDQPNLAICRLSS